MFRLKIKKTNNLIMVFREKDKYKIHKETIIIITYMNTHNDLSHQVTETRIRILCSFTLSQLFSRLQMQLPLRNAR